MATSSEMKKLTISPCKLNNDGSVKVKSEKFELMLNPEKFTHKHAICYNQKTTFGQLGSESKFSATEAEKVNFDFTIDGTGVINPELNLPSVKEQIKKINGIVYEYKGNNHEPQYVRLLWGSLIFFGRLTSMSTEYTLFKPNGEPLRAKIALDFSGFMSAEEASLKANKSSPDLSHTIEVQAGDTLPLLCERIYKNSAYYIEVAKVNNLSNVRDIKPGLLLHFPPLR